MLSLLVLLFCEAVQVFARPSIKQQRSVQFEVRDDEELSQIDTADHSGFRLTIIAVVGSYLIWTLLTLLLIVFVGNRMRKRSQQSNATLNMVMMKPRTNPALTHAAPDPISPVSSPQAEVSSPQSPNKKTSIRSLGRSHKHKKSEMSISTVASFDETHRARGQEELADLYAAVIAHDEAKDMRAKIAARTPQEDQEEFYTPVSPVGEPETEQLWHSNRLPHPMAPTPVDDTFPEDARSPVSHHSRHSGRSGKSGTLSIISEIGHQVSNIVSPRHSRPRRISVKNKRISQPMMSADSVDENMYSDNVPLSPRLYNPGPPPLTPRQLEKQVKQEDIPPVPTQPYYYQNHDNQTNYQSSQRNERRTPPTLALHTTAATNSVASGAQTARLSSQQKPLPFREAYGDQTSSLRSAPPTKTTFVDRPAYMTNSKSKTPRTGVVPATPYSPYTPFTPITPITPSRLMTRAELKAERKEQRLKVLDERDLVQDDEEMWGKVK